jgi:hypothetical protein
MHIKIYRFVNKCYSAVVLFYIVWLNVLWQFLVVFSVVRKIKTGYKSMPLTTLVGVDGVDDNC